MTQKITEVLAEAGFSSDIIAATAISVKPGERRARITMPTTYAAIQLVEFTRDNPVKLDGGMIVFKEVQYFKTFSLDGGKIIFKDCRVEREKERQEKKSEYEKNHAEYLKRQAAAEERKKAAEEKKAARPEPPSRRVKRPSDASDTLSERSFCSSVSTAASLALSLDEERQVRKMERKLRDIAHLEELQAQGVVLDKLQVAKIAGKADIESSAVMRVVMLKVRAGAVRPALV